MLEALLLNKGQVLFCSSCLSNDVISDKDLRYYSNIPYLINLFKRVGVCS